MAGQELGMAEIVKLVLESTSTSGGSTEKHLTSFSPSKTLKNQLCNEIKRLSICSEEFTRLMAEESEKTSVGENL